MATARIPTVAAYRRLVPAVSLALLILVITVMATDEPNRPSEAVSPPTIQRVAVNSILFNGFSQSGNPALLMFTIAHSR